MYRVLIYSFTQKISILFFIGVKYSLAPCSCVDRAHYSAGTFKGFRMHAFSESLYPYQSTVHRRERSSNELSTFSYVGNITLSKRNNMQLFLWIKSYNDPAKQCRLVKLRSEYQGGPPAGSHC